MLQTGEEGRFLTVDSVRDVETRGQLAALEGKRHLRQHWSLEAPAFSALLRLDNQRVPSVGTDRRLVELNHANLLGFGDRFNATRLGRFLN